MMLQCVQVKIVTKEINVIGRKPSHATNGIASPILKRTAWKTTIETLLD